MITNTPETTKLSIVTHNGVVTATNKETGAWRTFRVRTQPDDANFMPGRRLVSLLAGPDNSFDFIAFGYVDDNGKIVLWKKHRGSAFYEWVAAYLVNTAAYAEKVDTLFEGRCRKCNRALTTPESITSGIGPVCAGKE